MLEIFFAMLAAGLNATAPEAGAADVAEVPPAIVAPTPEAQPAPADTVTIDEDTVVIGQGVVVEGAPAASAPAPQGFNMDVVPAGLVAEPQTPSGTFTTATEVKPILDATKANWVALRDYDGQDLLYITHLWSWRCGLKAIAISLNDEPMQNWPLPPCHDQTGAPNAILPEDGLPYLTLRGGGVQSIAVQIVYDDLSMDVARFERAQVLLP